MGRGGGVTANKSERWPWSRTCTCGARDLVFDPFAVRPTDCMCVKTSRTVGPDAFELLVRERDGAAISACEATGDFCSLQLRCRCGA